MAEPIDGDRWTQKLATGKAMASYAYYDQIGGVEANSTIPGFKLQMYPALPVRPELTTRRRAERWRCHVPDQNQPSCRFRAARPSGG